MSNKTGNMYRNTSLRNGGRKAGTGIISDDYSEESMGRDHYRSVLVRFPSDGIKPEELNGPVICYKESTKMD